MKNSLTYVGFCFVLCFRGSDHSLTFISALQGETVVLKYSANPTCVDWYGPARNETESRSVEELDMYHQRRKWNVSLYSDDALIKESLPHKNRLDIIGNNTIGEFFLEIRNVTVNDAGLYQCQLFTVIMHNVTSVTFSIIVQLKYMANLSITYEPSSPIHEGSSLRLCCLSNSRLPLETVKWYNQNHDQQQLHNQSASCLYFKKIDRNESGVYTCKSELEGQDFTTNTTLHVFCPPVVVKENKRIQYGEYGKQMNLKIIVYSLSTITCQNIETTDGEVITLEAEKNLITTSDEFYGKQIALYGWQVVFRFKQLTAIQLRKYNVTLCNEYGNISYITEIQSEGYVTKKNKTALIAMTIGVLVLAVIVLLIVKCLVSHRKRNNSLNVEDEVQAAEGQNNQMISTEARSIVEHRNTSFVSGERHLAFQNNDCDILDQSIATSSDNDSHTSEHLDDGYERPYTTLMAHNYVEDEHVYNNTTHNSFNDTSTPFPIVTCKPIVGITKPYASQDNKNTHFCVDDGQENIVRNTGEYINLSLKQ